MSVSEKGLQWAGLLRYCLGEHRQPPFKKRKGDGMFCKIWIRILPKLRQLNHGAGPCAGYKGVMQMSLGRKHNSIMYLEWMIKTYIEVSAFLEYKLTILHTSCILLKLSKCSAARNCFFFFLFFENTIVFISWFCFIDASKTVCMLSLRFKMCMFCFLYEIYFCEV